MALTNQKASTPKYPHWIVGWLVTPAGRIPRVSSQLTALDILGFWRMRWRIGRMSYKVSPGLYALGKPGPDSPVLVSANYKMSFDILRRAMAGREAWILVIDTKGINVWCAAGKGTFSAMEILHRIDAADLRQVAPKGVIVLPQLSATGVKAHMLQKFSGFRTVFGPVRAGDLPQFIDKGLQAEPEMRRVKFGIMDRLVLAPVELMWSLKYWLALVVILLIFGGISRGGFSIERALDMATTGGIAVLGAIIGGTVITPLLLPWLLGRPFSVKGGQIGLVWAAAILIYRWFFSDVGASPDILESVGGLIFLPAVSAYFALNFTGSSTYTNMSGVRKEMRLALPGIIGSVVVGGMLFIVDSVIV